MRAAKHICSALLLLLLAVPGPGPLAQEQLGPFYELSRRLLLNSAEGDKIFAEVKARSGQQLLRCLEALEALGRSGPQVWAERCDQNPTPEMRKQCKEENLDNWGDWIATLLVVARGEKKWFDTNAARDLYITQAVITQNFGTAAYESMGLSKLEAAKPLYACD